MPAASRPPTSLRFRPAEKASPAPVSSTGAPSASRRRASSPFMTDVPSAFLPGPSMVMTFMRRHDRLDAARGHGHRDGVELVPAREASRCPFCHAPPGADVVTCEGCSAVLHAECWAQHGGCSVYGCTSGAASASSGARVSARSPVVVRAQVRCFWTPCTNLAPASAGVCADHRARIDAQGRNLRSKRLPYEPRSRLGQWAYRWLLIALRAVFRPGVRTCDRCSDEAL